MARKGRMRRKPKGRFFVVTALLILFIIAVVLAISILSGKNNPPAPIEPGNSPAPGASGAPEQSPIANPTAEPMFSPHPVEGTRPSDFGMLTGMMVDGKEVDSYTRKDRVSFGVGERYSALEGVITFRGNNFRDSAAYGTATVTNKKFGAVKWAVATGSLPKMVGSGSWTGSGWTGQPLIVKWPKETKKIMNMYDWAKEKEGLVEAIYATMDGDIYFIDIETGEKTRDNIALKHPFKGAGALDPRGIPLMYLGSGDASPTEGSSSQKAFVVSLVTGEILYEFGKKDDFALRSWHAYDSSPIVCAQSDTLIYPGENGIVYMMKLNTQYDEAAGTLSVHPSEVVKWRYKADRSNKNEKYWLGVEASVAAFKDYIIFPDNGGLLMCVNVNTNEIVWVQDTLDDTNCSPVLEFEDGHPYVYVSTSFHAGWRAGADEKAAVPIWKIDAETGEIVWRKDYMCGTVSDLSGGVQGTLAIGKGKLSDFIFVPISRTPSRNSGILVALDKKTGEEKWTFEMENYPWSSPVIIYDEEGNGYIIQCNQAGNMYLIDGITGQLLDTINLGGNIEASPAVFNGMIVVGTRQNRIFGIPIK